MSQKSGPARVRRILFVTGWVLGFWGLLLLADDVWQGTRANNLSGVVLIAIAIVVLLFSRTRPKSTDDEAAPPD